MSSGTPTKPCIMRPDDRDWTWTDLAALITSYRAFSLISTKVSVGDRGDPDVIRDGAEMVDRRQLLTSFKILSSGENQYKRQWCTVIWQKNQGIITEDSDYKFGQLTTSNIASTVIGKKVS